MPNKSNRSFLLFLVALCSLSAPFAIGSWVKAQVPTAPATFKTEYPINRGLDANLYMQTSAEYRACCYQAYSLATLRLQEAVAKRDGRKLAVIMDLDETVFDNSGFQAMLQRSNLTYDQRLWDMWEKENFEQVGLIPGAGEFIAEAGKLDVAVVYLSNRNEKFRDSTKKALLRLGIPARDESLLVLSSGTSDKTIRRSEVEKNFAVALYVGDNLRDFDEAFRFSKLEKKTPEELDAAIKARKESTDKSRDKFGKQWIILPNPAYGEWTKPFGQGRADFDRLVPTSSSK